MIAWQGLDHPIHPPQEKISRDVPSQKNMGKNQSTNCLGSRWVFPKIEIPPKWMVYNGNPSQNGMIWGVSTPLFSETPPVVPGNTSINLKWHHLQCWEDLVQMSLKQIPRQWKIPMRGFGGKRWMKFFVGKGLDVFFWGKVSWRSLLDRFEVEVFFIEITKSPTHVCKMFRPFSNVIHSESIHDVSVHFYVQFQTES